LIKPTSRVTAEKKVREEKSEAQNARSDVENWILQTHKNQFATS
jgi:hypothetical protein